MPTSYELEHAPRELTKLSIVGKQKRCMMNTSMLEAVLSAGFTRVVKN